MRVIDSCARLKRVVQVHTTNSDPPRPGSAFDDLNNSKPTMLGHSNLLSAHEVGCEKWRGCVSMSVRESFKKVQPLPPGNNGLYLCLSNSEVDVIVTVRALLCCSNMWCVLCCLPGRLVLATLRDSGMRHLSFICLTLVGVQFRPLPSFFQSPLYSCVCKCCYAAALLQGSDP